MYTSKSLLDSITIGKLEFDCINIVEWLAANRDSQFMPAGMRLPIEQLSAPVERLSNGCYGAVYRLLGYPGLILKVCFNPTDGYPEYIRSVAVKRAPKWAPKIFAHGGDETNGGFWCVMPAYEDMRRTSEWDDCVSHEAIRLRYAAGDWFPNGVDHYHANEYVRTYSADIEATVGELLKGGARSDMHAGNLMYDPEMKHYVITDPIAQWNPEDKEAYRRANS